MSTAAPPSTPAAKSHPHAHVRRHASEHATAPAAGTAAASSPLKVKPSMCGPAPAIAYIPAAAMPAAGDTSSRPITPRRTVIATPASTAPSRIAHGRSASDSSAR